MNGLAVWAELPQKTDSAGWLSESSNDYDSEDQIQRSQHQDYRREHTTSFTEYYSDRKTSLSDVCHTPMFAPGLARRC